MNCRKAREAALGYSTLQKSDKIYVAGHNGMVGSAIVRELQVEDCKLITRTHEELDLTNQQQVNDFYIINIFLLCGLRHQ